MYLLLLLPIIACSLVQGTIFDISNCPAGYFCLGKSITPIPCPVGTWSNAGAAQCTPCETGYYSAKAGSSYCTICEQGHFCDLKHLPPQPCPLGTYNDKLGKTQCIDCGSGTYTPKQASVECTLCPPGSYCPDPAISPKQCSPGKPISFETISFPTSFTILFLQGISVPVVKYHAMHVLKAAILLKIVLHNVIHVQLVITV
jgi:hypothetical protein